ncbi:hypothetical protein B9Z55_002637 [Caenorhabditis nigoni]|uniref:Uncharacterized protein n=1 Tax=Caenorhabditis nigoni TaxID=1611254 RepID=A0A2G5VLP6_9PELO|nr:hypothetical protein B9Z55_002637 [Caenorhabditis nigoni]
MRSIVAKFQNSFSSSSCIFRSPKKEAKIASKVLIITLLIITIFVVMFALGIYVFYDAIAEHINNIAGSF